MDDATDGDSSHGSTLGFGTRRTVLKTAARLSAVGAVTTGTASADSHTWSVSSPRRNPVGPGGSGR